jgi:peptidoglycan hydrolase-like protein with peptidoglycan-binding domain
MPHRRPASRLLRRMRRPRLLIALATIAGSLLGLLSLLPPGENAAVSATASPTAPVSRRGLTARVTLDGRLERPDTRALYWLQAPPPSTQPEPDPSAAIQAAQTDATGTDTGGTLTALVSQGTRVDTGDVAFRIDDRPHVVMLGDDVAYRDLAEGVADGPDVAQLEENLAALGFTDAGQLGVDEHFDDHTTAAVQDWQTRLGVEATGSVALGDVLFLPQPATVVATAATVGDPVPPGARLLDVAADTLVATGALPVGQRGNVRKGSAATITLTDGSTVSGSVLTVGRDATRAEEASITESNVELTIQLNSTDSAAAVDAADVTIAVTTATRGAVLAIPVAAVLDGGDGQTAVQVPSGDAARPVPVETGLAAGGYVEIAPGAVDEGDPVLLPGPNPATSP